METRLFIALYYPPLPLPLPLRLPLCSVSPFFPSTLCFFFSFFRFFVFCSVGSWAHLTSRLLGVGRLAFDRSSTADKRQTRFCVPPALQGITASLGLPVMYNIHHGARPPRHVFLSACGWLTFQKSSARVISRDVVCSFVTYPA